MLQKLSEGQRRTIAHWAMEFVVVVAGVLLALWLQEMVARAGRREAAKAAEDAIHAEFDYNLMVLVAMNSLSDCQGSRLHEIEAALANSDSANSIGEDYFDDGKQRAHPGIYSTFGRGAAQSPFGQDSPEGTHNPDSAEWQVLARRAKARSFPASLARGHSGCWP